MADAQAGGDRRFFLTKTDRNTNVIESARKPGGFMVRSSAFIFVLLSAAVATAVTVRVDPARARFEKEWGGTEDPDQDCRFRVDPHRLMIMVPGTPHALSAEIGKVNGPRVLRAVAGDFCAEVHVEGVLPMDPHSPMPGRWAYFGAGLLVWQDDQNYVRFERSRMHIQPSGQWRCYPCFELRAGGKVTRRWQVSDGTLDDAKPAFLRLVRRGGTLTASYTQYDGDWKELPPLEIDFGGKVRVGVAACHSTLTEFTAVFERLQISALDVR
jgi:regulation of enolase protein 1 (concanavalin A-like superfamily)